ncbi:MAG: DEAD/DEAH box helicase, partial [Chloroflexota bacterium]|nr:DEAD/DEAH box helicase [Chloroflexota bacterium]
MIDKFINPITTSFELLERYKKLLRNTLHIQGLHQGEVDEILQSIQVDQGLFLTLNRRYKTGQTPFRQFCTNQSLADSISDRFPKLASKRLYAHQEGAIKSILAGQATIVSTGTGSGKTEAFLIPILDHCLKHPGPGVKAIVIYPMNALANDQVRRLEKATAVPPMITFGLFTGSTDERNRKAIRRDPPDILITNYVMLDWMLTRSKDQPIFESSRNTLKYIVLDEIHIYRGNKATHLKYLLARLKSRLSGQIVQVGTSATLQTKDQT